MTTQTSLTHRESAVHWAKSMFRLPSFAIFDTETTGLGKNDEIVSLAVVDHHGEVIFNSLIRPTQPIPPNATAIHGISNADVASAPTFRDCYPLLQSLFKGNTLVAYNLDFDLRLLRQSCRQWGLAPFSSIAGSFCAMKWYARYRGIRSAYGDFKWHRLAEACQQCGIEVHNAHQAGADCIMTYKLMRHMAMSE